MGGCMSLDGGPAGARRDPRFHSRSTLPSPPPLPHPAVFPEDEPVVKQVLPDTRRRPLSPLPANDEKSPYSPDSPPAKAKPAGAQADHGCMAGGNDPETRLSPSRLQPSPLFGSTLRSASAREHPGDGSGMQQPEMMMMMTTWGGGGQGMLGRRARSLRDPPQGPFLPEAEKQRKPAGPGKETLENPLVSLECFIFL